MIVVDSSVWIDQLRGANSREVHLLETLPRPHEIVVGDLIVLEVIQGARSEREAAFLEHGFQRHGITRMLDGRLAIAAASHYRQLRGLGITVRKTVDLVIATFCMAHGHHLLHRDRDFGPFEQHLGLTVIR